VIVFCASEGLIWVAGKRQPARKRQLALLAWVALATILASLASPYFIEHWLYPFRVMSMSAVKSYITEWQSPDFHKPTFQAYLALVFATLVAAMYRDKRPDLTEISVTGVFLAAGFVAVRHVAISALALVPFAAASFADLRQGRRPSIESTSAAESASRRLAAARRMDLSRKQLPINWLVLALLLVGFLFYYPSRRASEDRDMNTIDPVGATDFILKAGIKGRMLNTFHFGGYLIDRLYPAQKVFIDGRADMYGDDFIREYLEMTVGAPDWQRLFDKYRVDYLVVQRDTALRQLLLCRGDYKLVYDDAENSVLLKDAPEYVDIIRQYGRVSERSGEGRCAS
jgi:hypothetical protein